MRKLQMVGGKGDVISAVVGESAPSFSFLSVTFDGGMRKKERNNTNET